MNKTTGKRNIFFFSHMLPTAQGLVSFNHFINRSQRCSASQCNERENNQCKHIFCVADLRCAALDNLWETYKNRWEKKTSSALSLYLFFYFILFYINFLWFSKINFFFFSRFFCSKWVSLMNYFLLDSKWRKLMVLFFF